MSSGDGESISSAAVTTRHSLVARAVAPDEKDGIKASLRAVASSITSNEDVPLQSSTNQFRAADQGDPATTTRLSSTTIVSEEEEPSSSRSSEAAGWIDTKPPAEVTDDDYDAEHDDASDMDGLEEAVTTTTTVLVTPPSPTFARKDTALPKIHLMGHGNKRRNRSSSTPVAEDDDGRLSVFETPRDSRRSSMATPREQLGSALKKQRELESRIIELEYKEKMMIDYQEEQEGMLEELTNVIDQQEEDLFLLNLDIVEKEESDERHLLIAQLEEELNEYLTAFIFQLPQQQVILPPARSSSQCRNSVSTATSPILPRARFLHNKFSSSSRPRSEQNAVMTDAASPTRRATILNSSQSTPDSRVSHKQQQPRQNVSSDEQPSAGGEGRRSSIARVSALTMDEEMETGGLLPSSYESIGEQYGKSYVQEDSSWVVFEQDAVDDHSESKILMQQPQELQPASSSTTTTGTAPTNVVGPSSGPIQLHQSHVVLSPAGQRAGALASSSDDHTKKRITDLESQIAGLVRQQQNLVQQIQQQQQQQQQQQRHEGQVFKATDYANEERNAPTSSETEARNSRDTAPLNNKNRRGWVSWLLYSSLCLVLYLFAAYGISQALKFRLVRDLIRWLEQQFGTGSKHIAEYAERCSSFFNPIGQ